MKVSTKLYGNILSPGYSNWFYFTNDKVDINWKWHSGNTNDYLRV